MKTKLLAILLASAIGVLAHPAAALDVFACDPMLGALAREIGGDKVSVFNAVAPKQDPHFIEARPSLIAAARRADLVFCVGADLEVGWLPLVLRQSSNGRIQPGTTGYLMAAPHLRLIEVPARVDRSEGDVHPMGNPHIFGDPNNLITLTAALAERLAKIDAPNATYYTKNGSDFTARWRTLISGWEEQAKPLQGTGVVVQHRLWSYLINWLKLAEVGSIEPKPGVPPGAAYLADLVNQVPKRGAKLILIGPYENPALPNSVSERTGVPILRLPYTVGGAPEAADLASVYGFTVDRLISALQGRGVTR